MEFREIKDYLGEIKMSQKTRANKISTQRLDCMGYKKASFISANTND